MNQIKQFVRWLFKRGSRNISGLISYIFVFMAIQFFDNNLVRNNPLILIPLFIALLILNQLIESLLCKILGDKNKEIGFGYFVLAIMIIIVFSTASN
ncbi:hypothetical protein QF028_002341 [Neobacillus sp. B4I6]